jgi:hypothetical protein
MAFLLTFFAFSIQTSWAQNPTTFPVNDVKSISVSLPKGKVSITSSKTQKDVSITVVGPKTPETKDKKCIQSVGLENAQAFVKISSENILFEKADCEYEVAIVTPVTKNFDLDLATGSAYVLVKDVNGAINLKTATGDVNVNGDVLKKYHGKNRHRSDEF